MDIVDTTHIRIFTNNHWLSHQATHFYAEILRLEINSRFASPNKTSYLYTTKAQKTKLVPWSFWAVCHIQIWFKNKCHKCIMMYNIDYNDSTIHKPEQFGPWLSPSNLGPLRIPFHDQVHTAVSREKTPQWTTPYEPKQRSWLQSVIIQDTW